MSGNRELIAWSLERLAELHGDPTARVYADLFARHPELERLFVLDRDGAVRGAMLSNVFEALLDMAGPRHYGLRQVLAECVNHEGMGVPPAQFVSFFAMVRDVVRDLLAQEWSAEVDAQWRALLGEIENGIATAG